jgi:hypothetical protein|tara:strand:- start:437 stop:661 length:225 start_codon:yes stop_codon:yes gene_type:complete
MTELSYNKIKEAAASNPNDSILGATVRRILQEELALEAMEFFDANPNPNQYTLDQMITEVENDDTDKFGESRSI